MQRPISSRKSFKYYHTLSKKEKKAFKAVIKQNKRKSLFRLLRLFERKPIKRSPEEDHAIVFEKVFNQRYRTKKDYLLRNEYRLLRQLLEDFLVGKAMEKALNENSALKDLYLLKALSNRNNPELAGFLAKAKIKAAKDAYRFNLAAEMTHFLFRLHANYRAPNPVDITMAVEALKEKKLLVDQHHFHACQVIRTQVGYCQRTLDHSIDFCKDFPQETGYLAEEVATSLSKFYSLKARSYLLPHGQEKITLLKQAYQLMEDFKAANPELSAEQEFCILTLALENFLIGDYEAAENYYEEFFKIFENSSSNHLPALYNYASNQIKLEKFEQVLELIRENEKYLEGNRRYALFFNVLRTSSFLRLGKPAELRQYLPVNFSGLPRNFNYYYRLVYCALFYLEGNLEIAIQEARNLIKVVKNDEELLPYYRMATCFVWFFQWKDKLKGKKALENLEKKVTAYSENMIPEYRDFMPFLWLKDEISKTLA